MKGLQLIEESKCSLQEVLSALETQKSGTSWAAATNVFSVQYARDLTNILGEVWYKGFLPQEYFLNILLPEHGHGDGSNIFFPLDTSVTQARVFYRNPDSKYSKVCLELINYLKEQIRTAGFTSSISLAVLDNKLKHVDGLHRIVALSLLLEDGYIYKPVPVFLCNPLR